MVVTITVNMKGGILINSHLVNEVEKVACMAGNLLKSNLGAILGTERKNDGEYVTKVDRESESLITKHLLELINCTCLGEEYGMNASASDYCWVIDPLDGTANFMNNYPAFAVSIGLLHAGEPVLGVVYDPNTDYMFSASKGNGAFLNGKPIQVNPRKALSDGSLVAIGGSKIFETDKALTFYPARIRRIGPTALHMCYVAAGFFDGCCEIYTKLWDIAGASCVLIEAGGLITDFDGAAVFPIEPTDAKLAIVATNKSTHTHHVKVVNGKL